MTYDQLAEEFQAGKMTYKELVKKLQLEAGISYNIKDVNPENHVSSVVSHTLEGTAVECHNTLRMPHEK